MPIPSGVKSDYGAHSAAPTGQTPISQVMSPTLGQGHGLKITSPILPEAEENARESGFEASDFLPQHRQIFLPKLSCDANGEMNYQGYARKIVTFDDYDHQPHLLHYKRTLNRTRRSRNDRTKADDTMLVFPPPLWHESAFRAYPP